MYQKIMLSRFCQKAGLFFFTINLIGILAMTGVFGITKEAVLKVQAENEPVVVVIDPGHGGDNLGGEYEDYTEKEMTMIVADAMKKELEQYEGITVYLTRTGDAGLTLEERCEYAKSVNADFLFCLHFNLSKNHTLFGTENWVSAFGEQYSKGYSFALIEMEMLQEMGLYSRGIKTRMNDEGQDYYGIIRQSTERGIPCVLIEHCHLDHENDKPFYDHKEKLEAFGRLDAEAVAKYYRLRSESLGKDFSDYPVPNIPVPSGVMKPDETPPDIAMIELAEQNPDNGEVTLQVLAADYDSGMLYYDYSYDGGEHFSELQRWPDKTKDTFSFTIQIPSGIIPQIVVNVYNGYDLYTTSNMINLLSVNYENKEEAIGEETLEQEIPEQEVMEQEAIEQGEIAKDGVEQEALEKETIEQETVEENQREMTLSYFMGVCIICALLVFAMLLSMILIVRSYKRRKRRRHKRYK